MDPSGRIVVDPAVLAGKPVIRGTRVPVHLILGLLAAGESFDDILREYPQLRREDLLAAAGYAASVLESAEWVDYGVV